MLSVRTKLKFLLFPDAFFKCIIKQHLRFIKSFDERGHNHSAVFVLNHDTKQGSIIYFAQDPYTTYFQILFRSKLGEPSYSV